MADNELVPGIFIDDFSDDFQEIANEIANIGCCMIDNFESGTCFNQIGTQLSCIGHTLYNHIGDREKYRFFLIDCILHEKDRLGIHDELCPYTEDELLRFSVGILENIFVKYRCHDVNYLKFSNDD